MSEKYIERGKIKKLFIERLYGFIELEDGTEAFFHNGDMAEGNIHNLRIGQEVEFILVSKPKGYTAKMLVSLE